MQSGDIIPCSSSNIMVVIILVISSSIFLPTEANYAGFSTELIHRDSPLSPLFNPNLSRFERLEIDAKHSLTHTEDIGSSSLIPDDGSYLMKISYGTPPVEFLQLVDTGSAISWIQCEPCVHCYPSQYQPFKPRNSRTFQFVMCSANKTCPYQIKYQDKSRIRGVYARDTITLGSDSHKVSFNNFLFGCAHDIVGNFPFKGAGMLGFRPKENSFINQLSSLHQGKFSMCIAPPTSNPGRISFGKEAEVSGPDVVTTPLILDSHYYYIMLDGISVGTEKLKYDHVPDAQTRLSSNKSRIVVNTGKMVIDSGTTAMFLPTQFYSQVERMVRKHIQLKPLENPREPLHLCYPTSLRDVDIPKIIVHFPGANLVLSPLNTFVGGSSRCLAIMPTKNIPIFGNIAQTNFLIAYNLVEKKVSFKKIDCSNLRL